MTAVEVARLRRGKATTADLRAALDRIGVEDGEDFAVVPVALVDDDGYVDLGRRQLGPFQRDSDTSRRAALDTYPRQGTQRHRVLGAVALARGGATADQVSAHLGLPPQTAGPRVWELRQGGWLQPTGEERMTRNGSMAAVYELTPKAVDHVRASAGARGRPRQPAGQGALDVG